MLRNTIRVLLGVLLALAVTACGAPVERYDLPDAKTVQQRVRADEARAREVARERARADTTNYREEGPTWALIFKLTARGKPFRSTGGCRLRFEFPPNTVANYPHFLWTTGRDPVPIRARMRLDDYGFTLPFDQRGAVQVSLDFSEWANLAAEGYVWVTYWLPHPLTGQLLLEEERKVRLEAPRNAGNLLAAEIRLPRVCGPFPRQNADRTRARDGLKIRVSETYQPFKK